jgi:hypothetical protein
MFLIHFACLLGFKLKNQCHEIFDRRFCHESSSPGPPIVPLASFFYFFSKNRKDVCTQGSFPDTDASSRSWIPIASFPPVSTTSVVTSFIRFILIADKPAVNLPWVSIDVSGNLPLVSIKPVFKNSKQCHIATP